MVEQQLTRLLKLNLDQYVKTSRVTYYGIEKAADKTKSWGKRVCSGTYLPSLKALAKLCVFLNLTQDEIKQLVELDLAPLYKAINKLK